MKISIITIVYNRVKSIEECINSVLLQDYPNIEYIIVDGESKDGTTQIIEKYQNKINVFISEKDNGVYDAFNKGVKCATGDIVGILNSDDLFYSNNTLSRVYQAFQISNADLVYAKGLYVNKDNINQVIRMYPSGPFKKNYLLYGWIPLHTTIFVRREIFTNYGLYDDTFQIAGDYEISLRWFKNDSLKKYFLNEWVVKMRLGGVSTSGKHQIKKSREDLKIIKSYDLPGYFTLACKIGRKIPQYITPFIHRNVANL